MGQPTSLEKCDFEVYGKVQKVGFRKWTQRKARQLGLRGWCRNTTYNTVRGYVEGPTADLDRFIRWLRTRGSPLSKISDCKVRARAQITSFRCEDFLVRR
ncbi:hypothetical protein Ciccas_009581 [Cichlidogyrus casuarinus]|uniref:acylphosphatase n=1 Tax=Cichlidogyrus casuarinus TaxID=1844966 RepID=A0ABD2PZC8_9PLAT